MSADAVRLVLLDRDGVLNVDRPDYVKSPDELVMLKGAAEAVARLTRAGWKTALVTNQSALGRGLMTDAELEAVHEKLQAAIVEAGGVLDIICFCPDAPENAGYHRKPEPGMLIEAMQAFGAIPAETPMIGDTLRDLEAAYRAGCPRILVLTGQGKSTLNAGLPEHLQPVVVVNELAAAVDVLLAEEKL